MFAWKFLQITLNHSFTNLFVKEIEIIMELHIIEIYAQTFCAMTLSITTLSWKILSIITCNILDLIVTLCINDIVHDDIQHTYCMSWGWVLHFPSFLCSVSLFWILICCVSWNPKICFRCLNVVENKYLKNMERCFEVNNCFAIQNRKWLLFFMDSTAESCMQLSHTYLTIRPAPTIYNFLNT